MIKKKGRHGQAMIEYLLVLVFVSILGIKLVRGLSGFMGDQFGSLTQVLSSHLTIGVCERSCFFSGYSNGFTPTGQ